jgi:hypothetical protein
MATKPTYNHEQHGNWARDARRKALKRSEKNQNAGGPMSIFQNKHRFRPPSPNPKRPLDPVEPARIQIIPGSYKAFDGSPVPYFEYVEHFSGRLQRGSICSKVWSEDDECDVHGSGKCIPCYEREHMPDGTKTADMPYSWRRLNGFLALHKAWYYLIPATTEKGEVITYQRDTKFHKKDDVIFDRVHEDEALAKYGRGKIKKEGWERVWGNLVHWSLGINHLLILSAKIADLQKECSCGGKIDFPIWECPECDGEVLDLLGKHKDLTKTEVNEYTSDQVQCPHCKKEVMLIGVPDCNKCQDPNPLKLWDVDLFVRREGTGTQSTLVISGHEFVEELEPELQELLPMKEFLHRVFAPDSLDKQAERYKCSNPYKAADAKRETTDYDKPDGASDEGEDVDDDEIPF